MLWLSCFNKLLVLFVIGIGDFLKHFWVFQLYTENGEKNKLSGDQFQAFELSYLSRLTPSCEIILKELLSKICGLFRLRAVF